MILHLMIFSKISEEYIKFLKENFSMKEHKIILWKGTNSHKIEREESENIKILETKKDLLLFYLKLNLLKKYNKIIIHGWNYPYLSLFLFFYPKLLKKLYWCIWGGDSRVITTEDKKGFKKFYKFFDVFCKTRVKAYVTQIKEEYLLIKSMYDVKGYYIDCFKYPGNMYKEKKINKNFKKKKYYIQIGNSAEERNHKEILKKLISHRDKIEKIYLPLSYGNSNNYVEKLLEDIPKELKDKVISILEIMPYSKYLEFLENIDIAIFPFDRQQAFGNIISLLSLGKTIYLKQETITYNCLKRLDLNVKKIDEIKELNLIKETDIQKNQLILKNKFSKNKLIEEWNNIFNEQ